MTLLKFFKNAAQSNCTSTATVSSAGECEIEFDDTKLEKTGQIYQAKLNLQENYLILVHI